MTQANPSTEPKPPSIPPATPKKGSAKFDRLVQPASIGRHTYVVVYVPETCSSYYVGEEVEIFVQEPPPSTVVIANSRTCQGTVLSLDE